MNFRYFITLGGVLAFFIAGCNASPAPSNSTGPAPTSEATPQIPGAPTADNSSQQRNFSTSVLIYAGDSAAFDGPEAITSIVESHGYTQRTVTSAELDSMSLDDLSKFGAIVWPGGYATQMSNSLSAATRERIRRAVNERGVGFVGFCAGAFIAVSPPAKAGEEGPAWGFAIVPEETLPYYHLEDEGTDDAMVDLKFADGTTRNIVWWGGPYLPSWPHGVIATYADNNQAAIAQTWAGKGLVVLAGPHPEAPESWRTKLGLEDRDGLDQEIAWNMIQAAVQQKPLPAIN